MDKLGDAVNGNDAEAGPSAIIWATAVTGSGLLALNPVPDSWKMSLSYPYTLLAGRQGFLGLYMTAIVNNGNVYSFLNIRHLTDIKAID